jgi:glutamate 5-kinase
MRGQQSSPCITNEEENHASIQKCKGYTEAACRSSATPLEPLGKIIVDEGAKKAILQKGKSLLPSGVLAAEGKFSLGDPVVLADIHGQEFAKGLTNYGSTEISKIKGLKTTEVEGKLGYKYSDEIIHRDDLVCPPFPSLGQSSPGLLCGPATRKGTGDSGGSR